MGKTLKKNPTQKVKKFKKTKKVHKKVKNNQKTAQNSLQMTKSNVVTDRPTDEGTYKVACTRLKLFLSKRKLESLLEIEEKAFVFIMKKVFNSKALVKMLRYN